MKRVSHQLWMCAGSVVLATALLLALGLTLTQAHTQGDVEMTRVTVASNADRDSQRVSLSADGTLVAFDSDSDLLGQGILNDQSEIWLYDTTTMTYTRVTTGSEINRQSVSPHLSADGAKLVFSSDSDFLGQGIAGNQYEAWLYDVTGKDLARLTTASGSDRGSWADSINADGTIVAISSDSDLLGQGIADEQWEIWLYNTTTMTYTRVTTASESNRQSYHPRFNADGTLVTFHSDSDFLGQGIQDEQWEIWLYDVPSGDLTRITHAPDSSRGSYAPSLSADGTKIAFTSDVDFLDQGVPQYQYEVWLYDVNGAVFTRVTTSDNNRDCDFVALNADGTKVAFHSDADYLGQGDVSDSQQEIWLYDVPGATLVRVTIGSEPLRRSRRPSLTSDGTQVAFQSSSDFLGQGIVSEQYEIWLFSLPGPYPSLTKAVDDQTPRPGQPITYTLSVVNPLSITLTNVVVFDTLPAELAFAGPVSVYPPQPGAVLADDPGNLPILASGLTVDAGTAITLSFPVTVGEGLAWGTVITNTAAFTSTETPTPTLGSVVLHVLFHLTGTDPAPNSHDAPLDADLFFAANSAVSATVITTRTVFVHGGFQGHLDGSFSFGSVTFDPASDLHPGELVQASVTGAVLSDDGWPIVPYVWGFRAATLGGSGVFITHSITSSLSSFQSLQVALGDLDDDGDLDVVLPNSGLDPETLWLNDGAGGLTLHPTTPEFGAGSSRDVALGDLDGDGDLDAVVANAITDTVWLNDGAGNFSAHPTTPELGADSSRRIALGDLDGDGDLDAVVTHYSQADAVWLNGGAGDLTPHPTTAGFGIGTSLDVELGDLDGDGDLDAVVAKSSLDDTVWLNDGDGNFVYHGVISSGASGGLATGDLDGDGDLDVVVAKSSDQPETVWLNDGAGKFSPHPTTPSFGAGNSQDLALGDLDGDGDLDAVVANRDEQPQTVWLNDGAGNLTAHSGSPAFGAGTSSSITLGDLDGDGDLDSIVGSSSGLDVTVWLNQDMYKVMLPLVLNGFPVIR